jgi:uncharacterized protein YbjT (DUF2867 family)
MRMLGDVGQIEVVQANVRNPASVARAVDGAEAVVNLVGVLWESGRQKFQTLHVMGAKTVAEQAKARRQASGADLGPRRRRGLVVEVPAPRPRAKPPSAPPSRARMVIRPSIVFGADDKFFNKFGQMAALFPALPLIGGGETKFQPVFVATWPQVIAKAAANPAAEGLTYELGGPAVYSFARCWSSS